MTIVFLLDDEFLIIVFGVINFGLCQRFSTR